jgi:leucyl aminopeptidase
MKTLLLGLLFIASFAQAHKDNLENFITKPILADLTDLRTLGIPTMAQDEYTGVGYAVVTPEMQLKIQELSHATGKCGGFEDLSLDQFFVSTSLDQLLGSLATLKQKNELYDRGPFRSVIAEKNSVIEGAISEISLENMKSTVQWLSSYPNRFNKAPQPNGHVEEMKKRLEALLVNAKVPFQVSLIDHGSTKQKSIRVRLMGSTKPNEIIVMGGHLDSINISMGGQRLAPGADDNASGSANLFEALRIISQKEQSLRTVDFFWYAGEESGLLGSAEIAKQYKAQKADVIAVLQLDMTLFPGSGNLVIGNMTDFTSSWLRDYLRSVNDLYIHAQLIEDKCGYGCSDHASWHRQGYATLMPFESRMKQYNPNIHSARDVVNKDSNFDHSVAYTKIALIFGMDLANTTIRQPY